MVKNRVALEEAPKWAINNSLLDKVCNLSRIANLSKAEMAQYNEDLKIKRDNYNTLKFAKDEGERIGLEKSEMIGLEKGRVEKNLEVIKLGHKVGLPIEMLMVVTKLSKKEVEAIIKKYYS